MLEKLENKPELANQAIALYNQLIYGGVIDSSNDKLAQDDHVDLFNYNNETFAVFENVQVKGLTTTLSLELKDTEK